MICFHFFLNQTLLNIVSIVLDLTSVLLSREIRLRVRICSIFSLSLYPAEMSLQQKRMNLGRRYSKSRFQDRNYSHSMGNSHNSNMGFSSYKRDDRDFNRDREIIRDRDSLSPQHRDMIQYIRRAWDGILQDIEWSKKLVNEKKPPQAIYYQESISIAARKA
ncbi:uncharacterized protein LOC141852657 [Brevipalpus obovatus]|uniref:uncharacterized protein LOC141852657 n=1 Tax=Brevipalpus obovatus TaxID=246614 RepID=UPI003D9E9640